MAFPAYPFVVRAKEAPSYWQPSSLASVLATGVQTNNAFTLIHSTHYDKGWEVNPRAHAQDKAVYVLKGQCHFNVGPHLRHLIVKAGDFVFIPKFTGHSYSVDEPETELLFFYTPAGPEQILIGTSVPALTHQRPPSDLPLAPAPLVKTLCAQYGLTDIETDESNPSQQEAPASSTGGLFPFHTSNQTAPAYWVVPALPELWITLAAGQQTGNAFTMTEMLLAEGNVAAPLEYSNIDESYYILDGNATLLLGDHTEEVATGDFVFIPRGTVFALRIDGKPLRGLAWHTPSGIIEGCLPLLGGKPAKERTLPPEDFERPKLDPVSFMAAARALGIRIIGVRDPLKP